jgi:hypothetical protein
VLETVQARRDADFIPLFHYLGEPDASVHHGVEAHPVEEPRVARGRRRSLLDRLRHEAGGVP